MVQGNVVGAIKLYVDDDCLRCRFKSSDISRAEFSCAISIALNWQKKFTNPSDKLIESVGKRTPYFPLGLPSTANSGSMTESLTFG